MTNGTFPDLRGLTEQLSHLTEQMQRTRQELDTVDVHGASPEGQVHATMRSGRLVALTIESAGMELDPVRLANQVLAAVQQCEARSTGILMRGTAHLAEAVAKTIDEVR